MRRDVGFWGFWDQISTFQWESEAAESPVMTLDYTFNSPVIINCQWETI